MISLNKICSKRGCFDYGIHPLRGCIYCSKHFRFIHMRNDAKTNNKYQPSFQELEYILIQCGSEMKCPKCNKKMILHFSDGDLKDLITLQHNHDQSIEFICYSCNCAHGNSKLGDKYFDIPKDHKYCSDCEKILLKIEFSKNRCMKNNIHNICKKCVKHLNKLKQQNRRLIGLCVKCKNKISKDGTYYCDEHMKENRIRNKKYRQGILS